MREIESTVSSWSDDVKNVHIEHQQFVDGSGNYPNILSWYKDRTNMIVEILKLFAPNANNVLDIGCAQGTIAIKLSELGYAVTANDIRDHYLVYARLRDNCKNVNFIGCNFLDYVPDKKFDVVIFTEVIEHIVDHSEFLRHIKEVMNPGGILIVTTPNHEFIRQPLPSFGEVDMSENSDKAFSGDGSDHFYLFNKNELIGVLENAGFKTLSHKYFLPFIQFGVFKTYLLWWIFPTKIMEMISKRFRNSRKLCAQQCAVVTLPPKNVLHG